MVAKPVVTIKPMCRFLKPVQVSCSLSGERIVATTFQPSRWNFFAASLPKPELAPVIRTVLSSIVRSFRFL
jgi:hypothetical protein